MVKDRILVVDDDTAILNLFSSFLVKDGYEVETAVDAKGAMDLVQANPFDAAFLDLYLPDYNGIELLKNIKEVEPSTVGILVTGCGSIETAVKAMSQGAFNYLTKPIKLKEVRSLLEEALETALERVNNQQEDVADKTLAIAGEMVGKSEAMDRVFKLIGKVADSESTILIQGESGTGKELVARTIHLNSDRKDGPYIPVNCGAIPENLLESELFGHEKGAFTGANATRLGRFELAAGGTIFLDEIGNMSPSMQVKLLRVLQEKKFERLGGMKTMETDVRVIAATNRNLEEAVEEGEFREDLYYRLNVIPIILPPLRDREGDIPLLVSHFLQKFNKLRKKKVQGFSFETLSMIERYHWPGNVRELENFVERMVVLKEDGIITPQDLPERVRMGKKNLHFVLPDIPEGGLCLEEMMNNIEKELILKALERTDWVKQQAANLLNVNRTTLVEKIKKKGLQQG